MKYVINIDAIRQAADELRPVAVSSSRSTRTRFASDIELGPILSAIIKAATDACGDACHSVIARCNQLTSHLQSVLDAISSICDRENITSGQAMTVSDSFTAFAMNSENIFGFEDMLKIPDSERSDAFEKILVARIHYDFESKTAKVMLYDMTDNIEYERVAD